HYTKGRKTSWTWAVQQLAKNSEYFLEMTGTPVPNWAHEIFTLLQAVFPERAKPGADLGSYWRWVQRWFVVLPNFQARSEHAKQIGGLLACSDACGDLPAWDPCEHYLEFVDANLGDRFLRRRREDFLADVDGQEVITWTTGARSVALDRVTVSDWLIQDPETRSAVPRGGKFDQLRLDLESRDRPTVVFAHYRDTVEACAAVARDLGAAVGVVHGGVSRAKSGEVVKSFKRGEIDVLVGSLETMAEGLQLTEADMLLMVEVSYKPSRNEQARMRVDRMGQTRPVTVREYVTPGTVDERKRWLLAERPTSNSD